MKKLYTSILLFFLSYSSSYSTHQQDNVEHSAIFSTIIEQLSKKWMLDNLYPLQYASLFNHFVGHAYSQRYDQEVILKIAESPEEIEALLYLQSDGIVNLLNFDSDHCALLLAYIPPQGTLRDFLLTHDEDWIIHEFVTLFKKIHEPQKSFDFNTFTTLQEQCSMLESHTFTKIPKHLIDHAYCLYQDLHTYSGKQTLLHGDLHCTNILRHKNSFIAIDPWPSVGPLAYDAAVFVSSPTDFLLAQKNVSEIIENRINQLSLLLDLNRKDVKNFAFLRVIILACQCEMRNKNEDWIEDFINIAEIILHLN